MVVCAFSWLLNFMLMSAASDCDVAELFLGFYNLARDVPDIQYYFGSGQIFGHFSLSGFGFGFRS